MREAGAGEFGAEVEGGGLYGYEYGCECQCQ